MKKALALLLMLALTIPICACSEEKNIDKNETLLKYYETSEEYFDYKSTFFHFRLPLYWKGKYIADIHADHEDFYEKTSFEENESGLIFSIYAYDDKSYRFKHKNYRYLCYAEGVKKHYVLVYPEKEKYIDSAKEIYDNLKGAVSIVLYTFKA